MVLGHNIFENIRRCIWDVLLKYPKFASSLTYTLPVTKARTSCCQYLQCCMNTEKLCQFWLKWFSKILIINSLKFKSWNWLIKIKKELVKNPQIYSRKISQSFCHYCLNSLWKYGEKKWQEQKEENWIQQWNGKESEAQGPTAAAD